MKKKALWNILLSIGGAAVITGGIYVFIADIHTNIRESGVIEQAESTAEEKIQNAQNIITSFEEVGRRAKEELENEYSVSVQQEESVPSVSEMDIVTVAKVVDGDTLRVIYDETEESREYPIVLLADRNSASASELLVAALSEINHAQIVGTKTYGKGKVQKVSVLSSGALFKYTYQEWLTPKGKYIDQIGIEPDIEINYEYSKEGKDNQKSKAIEVISK